MNTTTLKKEVYAMSFSQRGLMAGAGLEGSRITQFTPSS
jgi:lipid-binding SYLF domain-containing protein